MEKRSHLGQQNASNISLAVEIYIGISSTGEHSAVYTPLQGTGE